MRRIGWISLCWLIFAAGCALKKPTKPVESPPPPPPAHSWIERLPPIDGEEPPAEPGFWEKLNPFGPRRRYLTEQEVWTRENVLETEGNY